jgi:hypothetical protein
MTAHTPGPWKTFHDDGVVSAYEKTGEHKARIITIARCRSIADAHLTSAAPELLREVKEYRRTVACQVEHDEKTGADDEGIRLKQAKLGMLDALIAKAGGHAQGWRYRLLGTGDTIQADDEAIADDGVTWVNPTGWEIGQK